MFTKFLGQTGPGGTLKQTFGTHIVFDVFVHCVPESCGTELSSILRAIEVPFGSSIHDLANVSAPVHVDVTSTSMTMLRAGKML